MAKTKVSGATRKSRPSMDPDVRENQMISYAIDLAEKQLREGTASSQVITHYLKLGSSKERLEKQILEKQARLIDAKTQNIHSSEDQKELLEKAMRAFTTYRGGGDDDEYDY